jgi:hypothetical protein
MRAPATVTLYVDEQGLPVDLAIDGRSVHGTRSVSVRVEEGKRVLVTVEVEADRLEVLRAVDAR